MKAASEDGTSNGNVAGTGESLAAGPQAASTRTEADVLSDALRLLESRQPRAARNVIKILRYKPAETPEDYLLFLMTCYTREHRPRMALRYANRILERNPSHPMAMITAASSQLELRRLKEAADLAAAAIKQHPEESQPWITLATVCARRKRYEAAIRSARKAVALDPVDQSAVMTLAMLLMLVKRHKEALAPLKQLLKLYPYHSEAWLMLGGAQYDCGMYSAALRSLGRALEDEALDDDARASALTYAAGCCLARGNLRRYRFFANELRTNHGEHSLVRKMLEEMENAAQEIQVELKRPEQLERAAELRRARAILKTLQRARPLTDELYDLRERLAVTWDQISAVMVRITARPVNNKVAQALKANDEALAEAERLERQLETMFKYVAGLFNSAGALAPDFNADQFFTKLADLRVKLVSADEIAGETLLAVQGVFAFQTRQMGH